MPRYPGGPVKSRTFPAKLAARRSHRDYKPDPVDPELVRALCALALCSAVEERPAATRYRDHGGRRSARETDGDHSGQRLDGDRAGVPGVLRQQPAPAPDQRMARYPLRQRPYRHLLQCLGRCRHRPRHIYDGGGVDRPRLLPGQRHSQRGRKRSASSWACPNMFSPSPGSRSAGRRRRAISACACRSPRRSTRTGSPKTGISDNKSGPMTGAARKPSRFSRTSVAPTGFGEVEEYGWSDDKARQYAVPERASFGSFIRNKGFNLS